MIHPFLVQMADSTFPTGAFTASWGLEGLAATGQVHDPSSLGWFVDHQLRDRWATHDRWFITHAHRGGDLETLDALAEASSLVPAARAASRTIGRGLVRTTAALGRVDAVVLDARLRDGELFGHHAVMYGALSRRYPLDDCLVVHGVGFMSQISAAAVRLGVLGHLAAQLVVANHHETLMALIVQPLEASPSSTVPLADQAMSAHPQREMRLFSC